MRTAKFQYKCRLCGEIEENPCTGEDLAQYTLLSILRDKELIDLKVGVIPHMIESHLCKDGNHGVVDLIGYKIYDE